MLAPQDHHLGRWLFWTRGTAALSVWPNYRWSKKRLKKKRVTLLIGQRLKTWPQPVCSQTIFPRIVCSQTICQWTVCSQKISPPDSLLPNNLHPNSLLAINLLPSSLLPNNLLPGQFVLRHFNPKQFFSEHSFLSKTSFKRIVDFLQEKGRVRAYAILLFYFKPPEMLSHPLNYVWPALIGQLGS